TRPARRRPRSRYRHSRGTKISGALGVRRRHQKEARTAVQTHIDQLEAARAACIRPEIALDLSGVAAVAGHAFNDLLFQKALCAAGLRMKSPALKPWHPLPVGSVDRVSIA